MSVPPVIKGGFAKYVDNFTPGLAKTQAALDVALEKITGKGAVGDAPGVDPDTSAGTLIAYNASFGDHQMLQEFAAGATKKQIDLAKAVLQQS